MHYVAKTVSVLTFRHLDVNGRLQHVAGLAETLQASTTKLKDGACKAPLLTKISESFPRDYSRENTPPILPVDSQQRVVVPQVPLVRLMSGGLTQDVGGNFYEVASYYEHTPYAQARKRLYRLTFACEGWLGGWSTA
ncbi:unnamed protein product [Peronospora effusa]|nr:unnamed protein product [Peronospora effusa]